MNNTFQTRGTVQFINVRDTNLFMIIREDGQHGAMLRVKAFCPKDQQDAADMWHSQFKDLSIGALVHVEGALAHERCTTPGQDGSRVDVLHPVSGKVIYEPYIWAWDVREFYSPIRHQRRAQEPAASRPEQPGASRTAPPSPGRQQPAPSADGDDLPPLPPNDAPIQRAAVNWNVR